MNPLLFVHWRSVAARFTALCWLAVLLLSGAIICSTESHARSQEHRPAMVAR